MPKRKTLFININPGFRDAAGHHLGQNRLLAKNLKKNGYDYFVLGNKQVKAKLVEEEPYAISPTFTYNSWELDQANVSERHLIFEQELTQALRKLIRKNKPEQVICYMYMGTVKLLPSFFRVFAKFPKKLSYAINLFHLGKLFVDNKQQSAQLPNALQILQSTQKIRRLLNIQLFVESEKLSTVLNELIDEKLAVHPMYFELASMRNQFSDVPENLTNIQDRHLKILVPSANQQRGLTFLSHFLNEVESGNKLPKTHFTLRVLMPENPLNKVLIKELPKKTRLIEGSLPEPDYIRLFLDCDAILIPYESLHFRYRTSATYVDALMSLKPVITTQNTWAGDQTMKLGNGVLFEEDNVKSLLEAINQLQINYKMYLENARVARKTWKRSNDVKEFIRIVGKLTEYKNMTDVDTIPLIKNWLKNNPSYPITLGNKIIRKLKSIFKSRRS